MKESMELGEAAIELLDDDIHRIMLIMEHQLSKKGKLHAADILDTQMYALSRVVDFLVRLGLLKTIEGKEMMNQVEIQINHKYCERVG
ncbi:DUF1507 family protein [Ammoniphilus sp. YIM 78166]|uniref:DUF1507 family protein n=1 Tax=Ammoniphilus sp. YIM 78166 TaxID=1644106 RepID=UPI0010701A6F|nr:DUF1507 family protein [Ammoniphilus sp. YIM 78166]